MKSIFLTAFFLPIFLNAQPNSKNAIAWIILLRSYR